MSISQKEANDLSAYLANITKNTELEALALVTEEGLRLAFSALPDFNVNPDQLSSMGSVILQSGKDSIAKVGYSDLVEVVLRGINSFMVISSAGRFFLIGASRTIKELGKTVTVFRYYAGKISEQFPEV